MTTITSVKRAFREIKHFSLHAWDGDYRPAARQALKEILEERMQNSVDRHLHSIRDHQELVDRRNGSYSRHLLTELGDLELSVPRTRTFNPVGLLRRFARRTVAVERMILLSFLLGLSTRKVSRALLPVLGEPVSAQTVSRVARQLDHAVAAYHERSLSDAYEVLILDGVVLKRKTGVGAQKRVVLVALGIRKDQKKEIIDFQLAPAESQTAWEGFLNHLYQRGLRGQQLNLIITDGGPGLRAALPLVFGQVPVQRCWAHKMRNILDHVKKTDREKVRKSAQRISHARNLQTAQQAAQRFVKRWEPQYPKAVDCLKKDLPELMTFLRLSTELPAEALRTTNAIERRFREVRRRTRPMGTFSDRTSMERILFAVFMEENRKQRTGALFLLTQNS